MMKGFLLLVFMLGCASTDYLDPVDDARQAAICTDPKSDWDGDGIPNETEGCLFGRDTDFDGQPDWQDFDSDGDGIPDQIESGPKDSSGNCARAGTSKKSWPCDADGDGYADYVDVDSDGDKVADKDEDHDGDGALGCCLAVCGQPAGKQLERCRLSKVGDLVAGKPLEAGQEGCGPGQICEDGSCSPTVTFSCSDGETSPWVVDTFGDGKFDRDRGIFVCRDATEDRPAGRQRIATRTNSQKSGGDWHVAFHESGRYTELLLRSPGPKQAAAAIDLEKGNAVLAGFVISRDSTKGRVSDELNAIMESLRQRFSGKGTLTARSSGTQGRSHDNFGAVKGTTIDLTLSSAEDVSTVRNEVVTALLGMPQNALEVPPAAFGAKHQKLVIRFSIVRRFAFKISATGTLELDPQGYPIDSGDKTAWRLVVMGAVAAHESYQDPARETGLIVDDLSNGTGLATAAHKLGEECDVGTIKATPVADIVWVIDESGSMSGDRQNIVDNAKRFFNRALASGLDFRMAVTNVVRPSGSYKYALGKFCSKISTNNKDDGGDDRFLLPSEQSIFASCIKNPPGYEGGSEYGLVNAKEAMLKHLPRAINDPTKFRVGATIAFIVATDEYPHSLASTIGSANRRVCQLPSATQQSVDKALQPYVDLFSGVVDPEAVASFHVIGGGCGSTCAYVAHGYKDLAQKLNGQFGDICQADLGSTLQLIIDGIVGAASPIVLDHAPISASLTVALDGRQLDRSRTAGFDYRSASNSIALINVPSEIGSELIASYKRWKRDQVVK
jgi:hypothetical protein